MTEIQILALYGLLVILTLILQATGGLTQLGMGYRAAVMRGAQSPGLRGGWNARSTTQSPPWCSLRPPCC